MRYNIFEKDGGNMELRELKYFLAVAREQSISKAAEAKLQAIVL